MLASIANTTCSLWCFDFTLSSTVALSQKIHSWTVDTKSSHFVFCIHNTDVYCVLSQAQYVIWAETKTPWCSPAPQYFFYQNQHLFISTSCPTTDLNWSTGYVYLVDKIMCPGINIYVWRRAKYLQMYSLRDLLLL